MGVSLAEIGSHVGTNLDGLIGTDILAGYDTVIDPARNEVRVSKDELQLDGTHLHLDFLMGIPVTEATAAGHPVKMIFDTGAKISYVSSEIARACPSTGSLEDFFPGIGAFTAQTHTVPITLGPDTITITAGEMPMLLSMALMMAGASGSSARRSSTTSPSPTHREGERWCSSAKREGGLRCRDDADEASDRSSRIRTTACMSSSLIT